MPASDARLLNLPVIGDIWETYTRVIKLSSESFLAASWAHAVNLKEINRTVVRASYTTSANLAVNRVEL